MSKNMRETLHRLRSGAWLCLIVYMTKSRDLGPSTSNTARHKSSHVFIGELVCVCERYVDGSAQTHVRRPTVISLVYAQNFGIEKNPAPSYIFPTVETTTDNHTVRSPRFVPSTVCQFTALKFRSSPSLRLPPTYRDSSWFSHASRSRGVHLVCEAAPLLESVRLSLSFTRDVFFFHNFCLFAAVFHRLITVNTWISYAVEIPIWSLFGARLVICSLLGFCRPI